MPPLSLFGPRTGASRIASPVLLTAPLVEPVSLAEAKAWLKLDGADEDGLVSALITAARLSVEAATGRLLINQTWRLVLDAWPAKLALEVRLAPVQSIVAIRSYDAASAVTNYSPGSFLLDRSSCPARIVPTTQDLPFTNRLVAGIEVDLVIGYGPAATDVPQLLRQAMLVLVALWFENRGDAPSGAGSALPPAVEGLIAPFKNPRL